MSDTVLIFVNSQLNNNAYVKYYVRCVQYTLYSCTHILLRYICYSDGKKIKKLDKYL